MKIKKIFMEIYIKIAIMASLAIIVLWFREASDKAVWHSIRNHKSDSRVQTFLFLLL